MRAARKWGPRRALRTAAGAASNRLGPSGARPAGAPASDQTQTRHQQCGRRRLRYLQRIDDTCHLDLVAGDRIGEKEVGERESRERGWPERQRISGESSARQIG
jgi:hypothetical protein